MPLAAGWSRALAVAGTSLVVFGAASWITAFIILFSDPEVAFSQRLTPARSALMALGMLLLGLAVLTSQRLTGLRRLAPLLVGLYFPRPADVPAHLLPPRQRWRPGPNGALFGAWGLLWAWAAWASLTARRRG